jgi:IS605 OrfB family transposase
MTSRYRFLAVLQKQTPTPRATENILGIDQNSNGIGVTVINGGGKILRQLYLGRHIALGQIRYENRRAKLQAHRDLKGHRGKAGLKLRKLSGKQRNYVRTNIWMLAKAITELAEKYNAKIVIEQLRNLRGRKGQFSRKSRRKTNRIPYGFFRHALTHKSKFSGIPLVEVPAKYTSQTCPRCGYVSRSNRRNWRQFICVKCNFIANADRVASVNICRKAIQTTRLGSKDQNLPTGAPVSVPIRQDEEAKLATSTPPSCKFPTLVAEKLTFKNNLVV